MVDAIHREGGRAFQWTSLLWTWPVKHLQFPTLTALTPATVMSCYRGGLLCSNIVVILQRTSSSLIMDEKSTHNGSTHGILDSFSGYLWHRPTRLTEVVFNRGTWRQCYSAYPLASTDWWLEGARWLSRLFVFPEQMCFNPVRVK